MLHSHVLSAGDLDIKTGSYEGLWLQVCEALRRGHLLHASLLPTALMLQEAPMLLDLLLDAWTVAFSALVSGDRRINKYIMWHIMKYESPLIAVVHYTLLTGCLMKDITL